MRLLLEVGGIILIDATIFEPRVEEPESREELSASGGQFERADQPDEAMGFRAD